LFNLIVIMKNNELKIEEHPNNFFNEKLIFVYNEINKLFRIKNNIKFDEKNIKEEKK
jgi:hypothetical protein